MLLQGSASLANGTAYGDGLMCVGGTVKRLYSRRAVEGVFVAPAGGDPSVTARSASLGDPITPGATRFYQVYQRDSDAGFCPSPAGNAFNVSSGYRITW